MTDVTSLRIYLIIFLASITIIAGYGSGISFDSSGLFARRRIGNREKIRNVPVDSTSLVFRGGKCRANRILRMVSDLCAIVDGLISPRAKVTSVVHFWR